jgi:hypothetical protein
MNAYERSSLAAAAIVDIVTRHVERRDKYPSGEVKGQLEECISEANGCDQLRRFHIQAVRVAIKSGNIGMVHFLLTKDETKSILRDHPDNLQLVLSEQEDLGGGSTDPSKW